MNQARGEIELYNEWFSQADLDRDQKLSGQEAVAFFGKSGLNKQTLFKIWQGVAGDRPFLLRQEFYTSMKLVAVAQAQGGVLDDAVMARIVNGLGEKVGVPRMAGMNDGEDVGVVGVGKKDRAATHASSFPASSSSSEFPPMTAEKARVYQTAFDQLDGGSRQVLTGAACFGAFMQSGLSKKELKEIWDVVAGNAGELNRHQFVQAMYLIDWVKMSSKTVPRSLPAQFPPVASDAGGAGVIGRAAARGGGDIFSVGGLAAAAAMPEKAVFTGQQSDQSHQSHHAYTAHGVYASLSAGEQENLAEQERLANERAEQLRRAEQQRKEIAERQQFYTSALADLRLSQSKSSRGLVEAEQRLEMEKRAAADMEAQYEKAYEEFNEQHARIGPVLKELEAVEAEKSALVSKKTALESAVKNLEELDPDWEARERGECEALRVEIAELVARQAALEKSTEAMKRRWGSMIEAIDGLKATIAAEGEGVVALKAAVDGLDDEKRKEADVLIGLLKQLAPLYTTLYGAARDALVPLPAEVVLGAGGKKSVGYVYDEGRYGAYDSSEWHVFEEEAEFSVVTAIRADDRMEVFTSPSVRAIEETAMEEEEEEAVVDGADEDVGEVVEEGGEDVVVNEVEPSKIDNPVYAEEEDETQVAEADQPSHE